MAAARERHLNLTQKAKLLGEDARTAEVEATQLEAGGSLQLHCYQSSGVCITYCPGVRQLCSRLALQLPFHRFPLGLR